MIKASRITLAYWIAILALPISISCQNSTHLDLTTQLFMAISDGDHTRVQELIKKGANIELRDNQGATPLILAARLGNNTIVKILLKNKADINAVDSYFKDTALNWACYNGHKNVVETLIANKADIHIRDRDGYTALMDAVSNGHIHIVELLIKHGARIDDQSYRGYTAFSLAKIKDYTDIVELLRKHNADEELGEEIINLNIEKSLAKLNDIPMPKETKKEVRRSIIQQEDNKSSDKHSIQEYINLIFSLPWGKVSTDNFDIKHAKAILDEDHYGMTEVKDKILDFIATLNFRKDGKAPILCLVGPPGTGKTSIARSIARALGRKYERIALGGLHDEALLRGHSRTYIASRPGVIIKAIKHAQTLNPVIVLDEIDKLNQASGSHGDPTAAMLEVLDPEQNKEFRDNYLEAPFDLSRVLFIATANDLSAIPWALRDRMEIIEISSYSEHEKLAIAERYLLKKVIQEAGLEGKKISINQEILKKIIKDYSREAGVRGLQRILAKLMAKIARELIENNKLVTLDTHNLKKYLGPKEGLDEDIDDEPRVGVVNGLYWSAAGGGLSKIEIIAVPRTKGEPPLKLTGQLQTVAQESAETVISYARAHAKEFAIDDAMFVENSIHINWVSKYFMPVDGPSAGVAMLVATISALTKRPVNPTYAMTGAINLRGQVMPIGGLKEKILGAKRCGIQRIFIPHENKRDLDELDKFVTEGVEIILVKHVDEVLKRVLM